MKHIHVFSLEMIQRIASSTISMAAVVTLALLLTLLAIGYQPPDPVFQASKVMDQVVSTLRNATFEKEDTVLVTGEDILAPVPSQAPAEILGPALEKNLSVSVGVCDPGTTFINCSDPDVLVAIQLANKKKFPDMGVFQYGVPVRGSKDSACDIAWRFKPRHEKSLRMYRDYREYKLLVNTSCDYVVEKIGGWHSGKNAFFQRDFVNDSIYNRSFNTFWSSKYLYYSRGGDYCKSMNQYMWSFLCALGEARYLNRTLVVDLEMCLEGSYSPDLKPQEGKDFRLYFDYEHLQKKAAVVEQKQFLKRWLNWNKKHPQHPLSYRVVEDFNVTPMHLRSFENTILWRKFEQPEPNNYWYRVCEGEPEKVIHRPWDLLWKSKRLMNMVNSICGEMEWDFDAVHVVRGKKAEDKERWPNLDRDTMPEAIMEKLEKEVEEGRTLYIATNERLEGYFDKLRAKYRVHLLSDFKSLWGPHSLWYNQTMLLTRNKRVEFDGYMRAEVDSEVFLRAKKRIETFGHLTSDCKDGVNTC
ncbi:uncharacterized protein LOC9635335 isoform X3 [Selaginella moellendorffii]|nr:uncharacterized protein LOC9635335 isoform X3 [Selaginella moellendorffii]XP_024526045.1 uncharacterized protein LOC9635335 isoform X3 [Selaginella moellendorffii]|eukprot:XP_002965422.2 uncharacterized protein LOC9635335 isoform X3 [Selaginella moellendorffii]